MSRRASLPGASELFRSTGRPAFRDLLGDDTPPAPPSTSGGSVGSIGNADASDSRRRLAGAATAAPRRSSGRTSGKQKHDAKITVYMSAEQLLAIEQARLTLRGGHDLKVDRGRIVREAVSVLLADFDLHGEDSVLVQRLLGDIEDEDENAGTVEHVENPEEAAS